MARYALKFSKEGYIKYTSHLDMTRLFKRLFKRGEIRLKYSQGFNPHPKMAFAQPLTLGYESVCELLEFETQEEYAPEDIIKRVGATMPEGMKIISCTPLPPAKKTLASLVTDAEYLIAVPVEEKKEDAQKMCDVYLAQPRIMAKKKMKKSKELKDVDIKDKIVKMTGCYSDNLLIVDLTADAGSESNLSPELVIKTFIDFHKIPVRREDVEVMRKRMTIEGYSL